MATTTKPAAMEARLRIMGAGRCHYTVPVREGMEDAAAARAQAVAAHIATTKGIETTVEAYVAPVSK